MRITKEELQCFKPINNWVLIKPNSGYNKFKIGDQEYFLDITYNPHQHAPVTGTCVATPDKLFVGTYEFPGMQWDVDMEMRIGDVVTYSYLAAMRAIDDHEGRIVFVDDEIYLMIPYEECYVAQRKPVHPEWIDSKFFLFPLNGYCLVEPVKEHVAQQLGNIIISNTALLVVSVRFGRVAHASSLVRLYADGDGAPDIDQIKNGDYICFDRACDLVCEYDMHVSLPKTFYHVQRRHISAIIPNHLIETKS